jgi:hypothetical protein
MESLLLTAIAHTDPELKMPPKGERLPDAVIRDVTEWIRLGAPDPRDGKPAAASRPAVDLESGRQFWSYQKPVPREIPATKNPGWARRELDHFILAKLESASLSPSPDAEPSVLLRRLHFSLLGLPPSPADVDRFSARITSDGFEAAWVAEVDHLLSSTHQPSSANAGDDTGWTSPDLPNRAARKRTFRFRMPGGTGIMSWIA